MPSREECIAAAAEVYRAILSDPERAAQIRARRAEAEAVERASEQQETPAKSA
ncbi:MAG: hypothetical protein ACTHMS_23440 [Jatrophihabitans sp.]|uniref:hypothetical protein n=1 Tax=Jatrophihabitans sp. TaxID=1932789 RepID=UPI003F8023D4